MLLTLNLPYLGSSIRVSLDPSQDTSKPGYPQEDLDCFESWIQNGNRISGLPRPAHLEMEQAAELTNGGLPIIKRREERVISGVRSMDNEWRGFVFFYR